MLDFLGIFFSNAADFHGTGISVTTHPTAENPGIRNPFPEMIDDKTERKKYKKLPESYSNVKPAYIAAKDPKAPESPKPPDKLQPELTTTLSDAKSKENVWLQGCETIKANTDVSQGWSAFHAQSIDKQPIPAESSMLPLFHE